MRGGRAARVEDSSRSRVTLARLRALLCQTSSRDAFRVRFIEVLHSANSRADDIAEARVWRRIIRRRTRGPGRLRGGAIANRETAWRADGRTRSPWARAARSRPTAGRTECSDMDGRLCHGGALVGTFRESHSTGSSGLRRLSSIAHAPLRCVSAENLAAERSQRASGIGSAASRASIAGVVRGSRFVTPRM